MNAEAGWEETRAQVQRYQTMMDKPGQGQPKGWTPKRELENVGRCPVCGELFDCCDLEQVMAHLHGGKVEMVEIFGPPTRRT